VNHPLPTTAEDKQAQAMIMQLLVGLCVILGLSCLSASVSVFLVWVGRCMLTLLKAPVSKYLKLKDDILLSTFAFKFKLRRYIWERSSASKHLQMVSGLNRAVFWLGRAVQVDPMQSKLKPPGTNGLKLKCDLFCFQLLLSNSTCAATARCRDLGLLGLAAAAGPHPARLRRLQR
jgi:hypothetical protein